MAATAVAIATMKVAQVPGPGGDFQVVEREPRLLRTRGPVNPIERPAGLLPRLARDLSLWCGLPFLGNRPAF